MKNMIITRNAPVWHPIYQDGTAICYLAKFKKWLVFFRQEIGPVWVGEKQLELFTN